MSRSVAERHFSRDQEKKNLWRKAKINFFNGRSVSAGNGTHARQLRVAFRKRLSSRLITASFGSPECVQNSPGRVRRFFFDQSRFFFFFSDRPAPDFAIRSFQTVIQPVEKNYFRFSERTFRGDSGTFAILFDNRTPGKYVRFYVI